MRRRGDRSSHRPVIAGVGEFLGTTLLCAAELSVSADGRSLFIGELCIKTAIVSQTQAQLQTGTQSSSGVQAGLSNPTLLYISVGMGLARTCSRFVGY